MRKKFAGAMQLSITIAANAAAAALGVRDADEEDATSDWRGRGGREGANGTLTRVLRHQVSVETISIGFSGILFALNAIAMRILSGKSAISIRLDEIPYQLRLLAMEHLPQYIDRRWGSPTLELPAKWAPFAQVIASQCSDPVRTSFVGHLAGAFAALVLQGGELEFGWWRRQVSSRRGAARSAYPLALMPALYFMMRQLPLHLLVWWLGRRAVLEASTARHEPRSCTDWPATLRGIWREATKGAGTSTGRRSGLTGAPRTWGSGSWGGAARGRETNEEGFVGQRVSVVGLQRQKQLNGLEVRLGVSLEARSAIDASTQPLAFVCVLSLRAFLFVLSLLSACVSLHPPVLALCIWHGPGAP